jgi:outer membrane protein with beta-barrel domain
VAVGDFDLTPSLNLSSIGPPPHAQRRRPFDVYGKVGVATGDESFQGYAVVFGAPCVPVYCSFSGDANQTDSHPYFGVGFRHEISRMLAFRAEYEAIDRNGDDATTFSLGVAWEH